MRSAKKKFGKQRSGNAELGTGNRRTHDVKPTTLNTQLGTQRLAGPIFSYPSDDDITDTKAIRTLSSYEKQVKR